MTASQFSPERAFAERLDAQDELRRFRQAFVRAEDDLIYLDGNSLGRLTHAAADRLAQAVDAEWGSRLIRSWNEGWYTSPARVGDQIGRLIGAAPGQVVVCDSTSVNLFKLVMAALALRDERHTVITDALNFPSDVYVLQGCLRLHGDRHRLERLGHPDDIEPDLEALREAIDEDTALVTLSHVTFKSGFLYEAAAVTDLAHRHGALVLWDLSHSVGAVPIELDRWGVDLAVGCTYKYLNGGPGAPAFLYVARRLQEAALQPIWGWFGQTSPFAFDLDYHPAEGIHRFLVGTPPILSLLAIEAALQPIFEAGIDRIRRKSVGLTSYLVDLASSRLTPLGFVLGSPADPARRGSHVSLRHTEGYRINQALIREMSVLPDFREPDNLRLGLAPLYTSYAEVWDAVDRLAEVVRTRRYLAYDRERAPVT